MFFIGSATAGSAWAWGYPNHGRMARIVLEHPSMRPYVEQFPRFGLDVEEIVIRTNHEPPVKPVNFNYGIWANLSTPGYKPPPNYAPDFRTWKPTDEHIASLLHGACDSAVPISHSPSNQVYDNPSLWNHLRREDLFEGLDMFHLPPPLRPEDLLVGDYAAKVHVWQERQMDLARRYRDHKGKDSEFYDPCMRHGMILAQAVLLEYCRANGIVPPPQASARPDSAAKQDIILSLWIAMPILLGAGVLSVLLLVKSRRNSA
jgi:hypothetical protein